MLTWRKWVSVLFVCCLWSCVRHKLNVSQSASHPAIAVYFQHRHHKFMTTPQNKTDSLSLFFRSTIFSASIFIPTVLRKLDYNRWEKKRKRNKSRSVQMQLTSFILFQIFSWYWACLLTVVVVVVDRVISLFIFYALPPIGDKDCILSFWRFTLLLAGIPPPTCHFKAIQQMPAK